MDKEIVLRLVLLASLMVFFGFYISSPKTHCDDCSHEINGDSYSTRQFMDLYSEACLQPPKDELSIGLNSSLVYNTYYTPNITQKGEKTTKKLGINEQKGEKTIEMLRITY